MKNIEPVIKIKSALKNLNYMLKSFLICSLITSLLIFMPDCSSQSTIDKRMLRKQCHIPEYATQIYFKGYPDELGFGQREGIEMEGRFQLSKSDVEKFEIEV